MIRFAVALSALAILSGCASTAIWQNPSRAGEGHDGATMALAECEAYAAGLTPMPKMQAHVATPAPTSYETTGTYTNYGGYGTFRGTTTPSSSFASRYAAGANAGADIANAFAAGAARQQQENLSAACMRRLGWIDTSAPEGQAKFKQVTAEQTAAKAEAKKTSAENSSEQQWQTTISTFFDTEAARKGGIDYRKDKEKRELLGTYIKALVRIPEHVDKPMSWFPITAHELVLIEFPATQKQ